MIDSRRSTSNRDLHQAPLSQLYAALPLLLSSSTNTDSAHDNNNDDADPMHLPLDELDDLSVSLNTSREFKQRLDHLNLRSDRSHFQRLFTTRRTWSSEEQGATSRSKSARSSSKKSSNADSDSISSVPRLNRYALQKHHNDLYGTFHTPRSASNRHMSDGTYSSTARSTLTDISMTSGMNTSSSAHDDLGVYCPTVEEVRR